MGRRRGRGQRTFNPHQKEKMKDVGQEVVDKFNSAWEKLSEFTRQQALGMFLDLIREDKESFVGELIVEAQASAMIAIAFSLHRERKKMKRDRERIQDMVREEEEKVERALQASREAADAAFPGVEED